jgi:hypothetical protein
MRKGHVRSLVTYADVVARAWRRHVAGGEGPDPSDASNHLTRPITKQRLGELSGNARTLWLGRQVKEQRSIRSIVGCTRADAI